MFALTGLTMFLFLFVLPAAAQAEQKPPDNVAMWIAITSGFSMAIASAFCGIAQAKATAAACEGLARNPGAAPAIRFALILALILIETLALYTLVIVFAKVSY
jgi:F-type H+-transporting ATPase subunit c